MNRLIAAVVAVGVVVGVPAPVRATAPVERVLIVGDSVAQGSDGDHTWRYFAWHRLVAGGAAVDFVGPWRGTHGTEDVWGGGYADPDFDQDHAARWGQAMWQPLTAPDEWSPAVGDLVAAHDPDVVVEALGINDLAWTRFSAGQMAAQVREFVRQTRAAKPDVDVVLGGVPQEWIPQAAEFNDLLPGLAAELSTGASRVVAADVPELVEGVDTKDTAHPTTSGEEKLGAAYAAAIASLLREPVSLDKPEPVPAPVAQAPVTAPASIARPAAGAPRRLKAVQRGRRIVVTWRAGANADYHLVRCGRSETAVQGRRVVLRDATARTCKVRATNAAGASRWVKVRVRA